MILLNKCVVKENVMYNHKVQYYETDKMGITHHSNYIRWMEEARIDYFEQIGYPYEELEKQGVISPVVSVSCNYKKTTTFADTVCINVRVMKFNGVKLTLGYEMKNATGDIVCTAESVHCFINEKGYPVMVKKEYPDMYERFIDLQQSEE